MSEKSSNQIEVTDIEVGSDFVGRDKLELNLTIDSTSLSEEVHNYIQALSIKYLEESGEDRKFFSRIDDLEYFTPLEGEVLGVEQKLMDANFEYRLKNALRAKERFAKKLFKFEYFHSAQKIIAYILAKIESDFEMHIYPALDSSSKSELNDLIKTKIIEPVLKELGINVLGFDQVDVIGMIFFLTGTCHINWK